jgi:hypothetical protein
MASDCWYSSSAFFRSPRSWKTVARFDKTAPYKLHSLALRCSIDLKAQVNRSMASVNHPISRKQIPLMLKTCSDTSTLIVLSFAATKADSYLLAAASGLSRTRIASATHNRPTALSWDWQSTQTRQQTVSNPKAPSPSTRQDHDTSPQRPAARVQPKEWARHFPPAIPSQIAKPDERNKPTVSASGTQYRHSVHHTRAHTATSAAQRNSPQSLRGTSPTRAVPTLADAVTGIANYPQNAATQQNSSLLCIRAPKPTVQAIRHQIALLQNIQHLTSLLSC